MKKRSFLPLLGIALFILILLNIRLTDVVKSLSEANIQLLMISVAISFFLLFTKAVKWKIIIGSYDVSYPLRNSTVAWAIGFLLGLITPGRIGDLSRAYYLKSEAGISTGKSLTTVVVDRIIDIVVLFCLAIVGMVFVTTEFMNVNQALSYVVVLFILFIIGVLLLMRKNVVRKIIRPFYKRILPEKTHLALAKIFNDFYHGISQMNRSRITAATLICVANWGLTITQMWLLAIALGIDLSYLFFFAIAPIITLLDTLPISFSGIGTRDTALVLFFSLVAIPSEMAVSLSLLVFLTVYVPTGLFGALLWMKKPIKLDRGLRLT